MTTDQLVTKATKAARAMSRRRPHGDDRYEVSDMVQDGCLAELQGRSAWYGVIDGLRHWLGRYQEDVVLVPVNEGLDAYYSPDPLRRLIWREKMDRHLARLDKLKPKQRCAYMLRRHDGKRVKEVAKILDLHPQRIVMIVAQAEKFMEPYSLL